MFNLFKKNKNEADAIRFLISTDLSVAQLGDTKIDISGCRNAEELVAAVRTAATNLKLSAVEVDNCCAIAQQHYNDFGIEDAEIVKEEEVVVVEATTTEQQKDGIDDSILRTIIGALLEHQVKHGDYPCGNGVCVRVNTDTFEVTYLKEGVVINEDDHKEVIVKALFKLATSQFEQEAA